MVTVKQSQVFRNGVSLSEMNLTEIREFEAELTGTIIQHNDELTRALANNLNTIIPFLKNAIEYDTQRLEIVKAEVEACYETVLV